MVRVRSADDLKFELSLPKISDDGGERDGGHADQR